MTLIGNGAFGMDLTGSLSQILRAKSLMSVAYFEDILFGGFPVAWSTIFQPLFH
jgi:hypothetical protein